ncbi:hypothetical protein BCR41DRAFT_249174 [Lobosporangium transversale]|uniref:Uncharacterized protein n=1 Tax=Lobosporangium transversale TaxID=64571 RepID=A0A1Y2GUI3_9FUNG|nr:hypothetical protein BCR41DRAFT_249174 [Lobosporangium transversale]ORZ23917.1 hypothetical protein BCR41DRAFT_249174 [Lobosporangium transversale]|eukprot:XP_021883731.1 hypothetical protein BCR41DRAFT_249174 [Lobosporangium transversale]
MFYLVLTSLFLLRGEPGLIESKQDRQKAEWDFALNDYNLRGREVDLLFQCKTTVLRRKECRHNLAVFEAKPSAANDNTLSIQTLKATRLNKSIMSALHQQYGVDTSSVLLTLHGFVGYTYTVKRFNGYYAAGKVTEIPIVLPTSENEMYSFIAEEEDASVFSGCLQQSICLSA